MPTRAPLGKFLLAGLCALACSELRSTPPSSDRADGSQADPDGSGGQTGRGNGGDAGPANPGAAGDAGVDQPGGPDVTSDVTADPGGTGAPCSVGQTRCALTGAAVEVCAVGGAWKMQQACASICANGECAGSCLPDDKQCGAGQKPATCSKEGQWVPGEPCPNVCTGKGACTGDCKPGLAKCGDGPDSLTPYECDDKGKWVAKTACTNLCSNGSCGGSCQPGKTRCVGNMPQTCGAMGTWDPGQPCKDQACVDGKCTGVCEPKATTCGTANNVQTCDSNGAWQDGGPCSGKTCVKGACLGACEPSAPKRCSPDQKATQTCGANGVWMNGDVCADRGCQGAVCNMCKPGSKRCSGNALQICSADGVAWGQDQPCGVRCDAAKLVCVDMIACSPACNGSPHCGPNNASVVTESCDTTKGQCMVASTISTCSNGSSCKGTKCQFDCKCPTARRCKDDRHVVTDDNCDVNVGTCGEKPVETCDSVCDLGKCKIDHDQPCPLGDVGKVGNCTTGTKCQAVSGTCQSVRRPGGPCTPATQGSDCFVGEECINNVCLSISGTMSCTPDLDGKPVTPTGCATNCNPSGSLCNPQH